MTARRLRPISRLISCVRPPIRPLTDSRSERVFVARGSIAYSLVTQPSPEPLRQRGTPSVTLAATSTLVDPYSTSTDPSACSSQPRVNRTGLSSSGRRPSLRETMPVTLGAATDKEGCTGHGEIDGPGEVWDSFGEDLFGGEPRRDVSQHQPADLGTSRDLRGITTRQMDAWRVIGGIEEGPLGQQQVGAASQVVNRRIG